MDHVLGEPGRPPRRESARRTLVGWPADRRVAGRASECGEYAPSPGRDLGSGDGLSAGPPPRVIDRVSDRSASRSGRIDLVGAGLIGLTSLQFGAVVLMGRYASRSHLTVPAYLMWRFGFAAFLLAGAILVLRLPFQAAPGEG